MERAEHIRHYHPSLYFITVDAKCDNFDVRISPRQCEFYGNLNGMLKWIGMYQYNRKLSLCTVAKVTIKFDNVTEKHVYFVALAKNHDRKWCMTQSLSFNGSEKNSIPN